MSAGKSTIRILVVDDHPAMRAGVIAMLDDQEEIIVAGEAGDGAEALVQFRTLRPDLVVMDLQMPGMNGIDATLAIRAEAPSAKILVLTTFAGDAQAVRALRAGASGYLLKSSIGTQIVDAIRTIHKGKRHIDPIVSEQIALYVAEEALTDRELAVLELVAAGQPNKDVARALNLGEETVKSHLKNIFQKLSVTDRIRAVTVAIQRGILKP